MMSYGQLLYETPIDTYKSQIRKTMLSVIPLILVEVLILIVCFWFLLPISPVSHSTELSNELLGIVYSLFLISIPIVAIYAQRNYLITARLSIYENGFLSSKRPFANILKREQFYIDYSKVQQIKFTLFGQYCEILLPFNKRILLQSSYDDASGYLFLCSILIDRFMPIDKRPDLNKVKESLLMNEKNNNGEASIDEWRTAYHQMMEANKDFK